MPFPGVMWLGVPSIIVCRFCWKCSQNGVMGIEQTIKNGSARYSLLLQKGALQTKGLGASTLSGRSDQVLSLRRRFPPLAPHRLRTRVTIFPGCHLRFVLVNGVMSNTCKLLSGGLFAQPFTSLNICRVKTHEITLPNCFYEEGERTKDWQQAAIFRNLIHKLGL